MRMRRNESGSNGIQGSISSLLERVEGIRKRREEGRERESVCVLEERQ